MDSHPQLPPEVSVGHEEGDLHVGAVVWFGAGLAAVLLIVFVATAWLFFRFAQEEQRRKRSDLPLAAEAQAQDARVPPAPRLEGIEGPGRAGEDGVPRPAFVVSTRQDLSRPVRWIDEDRQVAAIPIEVPEDPNYTREFFERLLEADDLAVREGHTWLEASEVLPSDANSGRPPQERVP